MPRTPKYYNPITEELEDGPTVEDPHTGFRDWTPQQWGIFLAAVATFIAAVVNAVTGNPAGIPFAG